MAEYIERQKAANVLCNAICGSDRVLCVSTTENCQQKKMLELYELPAADVVPVVHGEWVEKDGDLYCSRCAHRIPDCAGNATVISRIENRYCYSCGAKMDGNKREC